MPVIYYEWQYDNLEKNPTHGQNYNTTIVSEEFKRLLNDQADLLILEYRTKDPRVEPLFSILKGEKPEPEALLRLAVLDKARQNVIEAEKVLKILKIEWK